MAFSTAQQQYLESVVTAYFNQFGHCYYFAYNDNDNNGADLHIIFATENMYFKSEHLDEFENGSYFVNAAGSITVAHIITGNPSSYNGDHTNRITYEDIKGESYVFTCPAYNTVSTNMTWFDGEQGSPVPLAGDLIGSEGVYYYEVQSDIQTQSLGIIGMLILLVLFFSWVFGKR